MGADLRSLALLRMGLGAIVVLDLCWRASDLAAHYSDQGVLPRTDLIALWPEPLWFSVHLASGEVGFQAILMLLAAACGVAMALGWRTRWATLLSWFWLCSLHARNPEVLNSGDVLLRLLLLWGIFLPWGEVWSLDSRGRPPRPVQVCGFGTAAYTLQVTLLYLSAGLHKSGAAWRDGSAVYYALSLDQMVRPLGHWLAGHPSLMTFLTHATVGFQLATPVLLFFPWRNGIFRTVAVVGTVAMHLGIGLHMRLGIFTLVAAIAGIGLLPSWFWRTRSEGLHRVTEPPAVKVLLAALIALNLLWNAGNLIPALRIPPAALVLPKILRMDQYWGMFAPQPMVHDGWFVVAGELSNGKVVDLRTGQALSWDKPAHFEDVYPSERWRKYLVSLYEVPDSPHRPLYCRYVARRWNEGHRGPWRVKAVMLFYMREVTPPPGQPPGPIERIQLHRYEVPDEKAPSWITGGRQGR